MEKFKLPTYNFLLIERDSFGRTVRIHAEP